MKFRTVCRLLRRLLLAGLLLVFLAVNGAGFYIGNIIYTEMSTRHDLPPKNSAAGSETFLLE